MVYYKIDWVFYNEKWHDVFNDCFTSYHEDPYSDHCFLMIKSICVDDKDYKPFKFFNTWVEHPSYEPVLKSIWSSTVSTSLMVRLLSKLSKLRRCLRKFNRGIFGDVIINYSEAK